MAILEMQKLSIYAMKEHRKEILEFLQRTGAMELIRENVEDGFEVMDTSQDRTKYEKIADSFDHVLELFKLYAPEKKSGLDVMLPPRSVKLPAPFAATPPCTQEFPTCKIDSMP